MSVETYDLMQRAAPQPASLTELSVIEGEAYEVEFAEPVVGPATVRRSILRVA